MTGCHCQQPANSCRSGEHTCAAGLGRKAVIQRPPVIGNHAPIAAARQLPYLFEGDRAFWLTPMDITVMPIMRMVDITVGLTMGMADIQK